MSLETTLARAEARNADEAWQYHRKNCYRCQSAARRRRYGECCAFGRVMLKIRHELREKAAREAELDKQPVPGQGELFAQEECRGQA